MSDAAPHPFAPRFEFAFTVALMSGGDYPLLRPDGVTSRFCETGAP